MSTYVKNYDGETKWMNCLIKDDQLLKKFDIWNKIGKKELDCESIYNKYFFENQNNAIW